MDYAAMSVGNMAEEHAAEGPLSQIVVAGSIEKLLARGSQRGYVTYDELSATLPLDQLSSEEIEDTMTMLSELGITIRAMASKAVEKTKSGTLVLAAAAIQSSLRPSNAA